MAVTSEGSHGTPRSYPLLSLLLSMHLFFVLTALTASYGRSELTGRILEQFSFYTRFLNFDLNLNFAPFFLTHATETDVDHEIEVLVKLDDEDANEDAVWLPLADHKFSGHEGSRRYQRLGRYLGLVSDDDATAARLAAAIGEHFVRSRSVSPTQIRCRRLLLQDWDAHRSGTADEGDPRSELYVRFPYAANCVVLAGGKVNVVKVEAASQVASPGEEPQSVP